jgi:hypothetical protein
MVRTQVMETRGHPLDIIADRPRREAALVVAAA